MNQRLQTGRLLVSTIALPDPNFQHTVVLLCQYEAGEGAYGLILNRELQMTQQLREQIPYADDRLFQGGPVEHGSVQVLHPYGDSLPGSTQVMPSVWYGGDAELLEAGFRAGDYDPGKCRFFLGYAGWSAGQLEGEVENNTWLIVEGTPRLVWETPPRKLWSGAVRSHKRSDPIYAYFPENPMLN